MKRRYLTLSSGAAFEGWAFGAEMEAVGELVFTTGMSGYIETLTDPSYFGQIVVQTFPLIGNYGVIEEDFEGTPFLSGYVVREWCDAPSNFRSQYDLDAFLKARGVPGIWGVDTREITRTLREEGVMNAALSDAPIQSLKSVRAYRVEGGVSQTSVKKPAQYPAAVEKNRVALVDYGAKKNILRELNARGCSVTEFPCHTPAETILSGGFDGVMLSNGPGDPADNAFEIAQIQKLMGRLPMFGICLGHQMMALSQGGETIKLKYGHRGANQPVKDLLGKRTYITSQNHGYAVKSAGKLGVFRYENANDHTLEGVDYPDLNAFSVQFHPEACSGPHDTSFLFDRFISMMGGARHADA